MCEKLTYWMWHVIFLMWNFTCNVSIEKRHIYKHYAYELFCTCSKWMNASTLVNNKCKHQGKNKRTEY